MSQHGAARQAAPFDIWIHSFGGGNFRKVKLVHARKTQFDKYIGSIYLWFLSYVSNLEARFFLGMCTFYHEYSKRCILVSLRLVSNLDCSYVFVFLLLIALSGVDLTCSYVFRFFW